MASLPRSRARPRKIPVALVNGRLSDRSFPRYRLVRRYLRRPLEAIGLFAVQSSQDALRFEALGIPPGRIRVCGNIKYDLPAAPPFADAARLDGLADGRPIFVAASTAEGEEQTVLEAFRGVGSRAVLVIAPRRPERFDAVATLIERSGFSVLRRSQTLDARRSTLDCVYLLDSIGELASLYREASLAFIGGSLVPIGGHNPIEAWAQGVPVVVGPHTQNFRDVISEGLARGFGRIAVDEAGLARAFTSVLENPEASRAAGQNAREFVAANRGAARTTVRAVLPLLAAASASETAAP